MDTYTYNLDSANNLTTGEAAVLGGALGTVLTISIIICILLIIAGWKIFEKAGEKGWKVLIPIYNCFILFKICGIEKWFWPMIGATFLASVLMGIDMPPTITEPSGINGIEHITLDLNGHNIYIVGMIISSIVAIATDIAVAVKLSKAFGKGFGYTLGLIFLPNIFTLILGFGSAKYNAKRLNS